VSRAYTAKQKAKAGVVLSLDDAGRLVVNAGFVKPGEVKNVAASELNLEGQRKKKKAAAGLSNALATRLSETLTEATATALAKDQKVALPAMIAGFTSLNTPVKVSESGLIAQGSKRRKSRFGAFAPAFQALLKGGIVKQCEALAAIAADALDFHMISSDKKPLADPNIAALTGAMDGKSLNAALRELFNAKDYFGGISSSMRVAAIREALGDGPADTAAKLKKDGQTAFAVANVQKTGWLPPELRTVHYDGPSAKAAKKPAAKKAKAKPAKKKAR
jgi:ParB family chromosome partitioning protein